MKQNSFDSLPRLRNDNYANIFNIYTDKDGFYFYNILQTVVIPTDLPKNYYTAYNTVYGDTWPFISYKNYKSIDLWWVILKTNSIQNPLLPIQPGTTLKILKQQYVSSILSEIATQQQ